MRTGIKVMDSMTKGLIVTKSSDSIRTCAKKMLKNGVGGLVIKDDGELLGMVTEKDIVEKIVAKNLDAEKTTVKDIMTKKLVTIDPSADLYDAFIKMRDEGIRRLPVVKNGEVVGLLTQKDILKIQPALFDLIVQKFRLREESGKPISQKPYMEGECENCGNFAQLYFINDQWVCEECKDTVASS